MEMRRATSRFASSSSTTFLYVKSGGVGAAASLLARARDPGTMAGARKLDDAEDGDECSGDVVLVDVADEMLARRVAPTLLVLLLLLLLLLL